MPIRRLSAVISLMLSAVDWMFSAPLPGIDLALGAVAAGWFGMMVGKPALFDGGNYLGMAWAPDAVWIVFVGSLVLMHLGGLISLARRWKLRAAACLLSAWYWIMIALSLSRPGLTTGTWTYSIIGIMALASAIYVSGHGTRRS